MILKVGYLPFPADQQLIDMTERVIVGHNASHRMDQFNAKLHKPGTKALQGVLRIQQLYVFAHGTTGGDAVLDSTGGSMTLTDLAQQLRDQKLTTSIHKIKLWACEGGKGADTSMAKQFKDALVTAGFTNVTVYGYTKLLASGLEDGHKFGGDTYNWDTGEYAGKSVASKMRVAF